MGKVDVRLVECSKRSDKWFKSQLRLLNKAILKNGSKNKKERENNLSKVSDFGFSLDEVR